MKLKAALLATTISTSSFATGLIPEAICTGTQDGETITMIVHVNGDVNYCEDRIDTEVVLTTQAEFHEGLETYAMIGKMEVTDTDAGTVVKVTPKTGYEGMSFTYTMTTNPGSGEGILVTPAEPEYDIEEETVTFQCDYPHYTMECHLDM